MKIGANNKQSTPDNIVLSLSIYSLNVIKKAAYKFSAEFSVTFKKIDEQQIKICFDFNPSISLESKATIIRQFHNELLDQNLREIVFKETEHVRNLILAHAFSKTTLIES